MYLTLDSYIWVWSSIWWPTWILLKIWHTIIYSSLFVYSDYMLLPGGVLPYVCILGMCHARDPHFQPWISVPEHIIFTNFKKNLFWSFTIFSFFGGVCRSGDHHFQNFFNFNPFITSHGRLSPNAKCSAAPRVSQTRPGSSGDWHFHTQNGSSSFRSPAF